MAAVRAGMAKPAMHIQQACVTYFMLCCLPAQLITSLFFSYTKVKVEQIKENKAKKLSRTLKKLSHILT